MRSSPALAAFLASLIVVSVSGCQTQNSTNQTAMTPHDQPTLAKGGLFIFEVPVAEAPHRYAIFVPPDLAAKRDTSQPIPCIVFLNGRGECGTDGLKQCLVGLIPAAMSAPIPVSQADPVHSGWGDFIIIAPQKPDYDSTWEQHEALVLGSLEHAKAMCKLAGWTLDSSRTYLSGLSQGGAGTWAIGAKHPETFAAIAPVCGFVPGSGKGAHFGGDAERQPVAAKLAAAKMPIWAFHGEKDDVVLPEQTRALVAAVAQAGWTGDVRATYYPDANHNSWDSTYRTDGAALARWFLAHRR